MMSLSSSSPRGSGSFFPCQGSIFQPVFPSQAVMPVIPWKVTSSRTRSGRLLSVTYFASKPPPARYLPERLRVVTPSIFGIPPILATYKPTISSADGCVAGVWPKSGAATHARTARLALRPSIRNLLLVKADGAPNGARAKDYYVPGLRGFCGRGSGLDDQVGAAEDLEGGARDSRSVVRGQKEDGLGHVARPELLRQGRRVDPFALVLAVLDGPGADGVDRDVVRAELAGEGLRHPDQAELRGALRDDVRIPAHSVDRRNVHDASAAALDHAAESRPAERRRPGQVRRDDAVPVLGGQLEE